MKMSQKLFLIISTVIAVTCYSSTTVKKEIILMDTGINLKKGDDKYLCVGANISFVDTEWYVDEVGHGTIMFETLKRGLTQDECIVIYKIFDLKKRSFAEPYIYALNAVSKILGNQKIVLAMEDVSYDIREIDFFKVITQDKEVFVAAGNDGVELKKDCKVYPACLKSFIKSENFHVVGALNGYNYGAIVDQKFDSKIILSGKVIDGTSISTARAAIQDIHCP